MSKEADTPAATNGSVTLNKSAFLRLLSEVGAQKKLSALKREVAAIKSLLVSPDGDPRRLFATRPKGEAVSFNRDALLGEIEQILGARTMERAKYYLQRLARGVEGVRTGKVNDINLYRWKEYEEILTDSLWLMPRRDASGAHLGWYWGNFIPQIPRQLMTRYTKKGDWVLDAFLGSGTTLIECRRMGRNGIGIELNPDVARKARQRIRQESNEHGVITEVIIGDCRSVDARRLLKKHGIKQVQLLLMHPPYHDIIKFSESAADLSGATGVEDFLRMFGEALDNTSPLLEAGRYLALVIGDKYEKGEWIPLGFRCMNEVVQRGYTLKSIIVKNFDETRAKRDQKQLWRYRALVGGFYIFKHEYIFLFQKK